jgi:hypothetical protein
MTRMAATVATVDLAARTAQLLGAVEGRLTAHERGTDPPRVTLGLGGRQPLASQLPRIAINDRRHCRADMHIQRHERLKPAPWSAPP